MGSVALIINAITKFRIAAAKTKEGTETRTKAKRYGLDKADLFFFVVGVSSMILGMAGLILMLTQKDGPATMREVVVAAMCLVNVMTGNLILVTTTIRVNSTNWIRGFSVALRNPDI